MSDRVCIELLPLGRTLIVERGTRLQDLLFAQGVEFPCGGQGRCLGCRVKLLKGSLTASSDERRLLSLDEIDAGWRLACRARAEVDLAIELAQWEAAILSDDSAFTFTPCDGFGVAVDLGTTTLVAQLLDLRTGCVRAVRTALNDQARHGADIMSRIEFATHGGGQGELTRLIRAQLGELIEQMIECAGSPGPELRDVVIVGNTAMHHLFCGLNTEPLASFPFATESGGLMTFSARDLGWTFPGKPGVRFLPCVGSFVGSDILAGILAKRMHQSKALVALVDLGTNGEMVVGNHERLLCASTAAGPAFEGARISQGMRAVTGAIAAVALEDGRPRCRVLGNVAPRGLCGSGLVDAAAAGLELGRIEPSGRLTGSAEFQLAPGVGVGQADIRELQLAKGAIAAGLRVLLEHWGAAPSDVAQLHLAGAFGNYIDRASARRIGLLPFPLETISPAGNTALLGAKLVLCGACREPELETLRRRVQHVALCDHARFQDVFAEEMLFPRE